MDTPAPASSSGRCALRRKVSTACTSSSLGGGAPGATERFSLALVALPELAICLPALAPMAKSTKGTAPTCVACGFSFPYFNFKKKNQDHACNHILPLPLYPFLHLLVKLVNASTPCLHRLSTSAQTAMMGEPPRLCEHRMHATCTYHRWILEETLL